MSRFIPDDHLKAVCRIGKGADCCRYIVGGAEGLECAKHQPSLKDQIDRRVLWGAFKAVADNCDGLKDEPPDVR